MYFQHVYDKSLAQASYFVGCQKTGTAVVIDPKRDVDTYNGVRHYFCGRGCHKQFVKDNQ